MLSLNVSNQPIDLPDDISISLKYSSPVFNEVGDFSYPFKIPATPRNIAILGFKHRVENTNSLNDEFDAELYWNGIMLETGTLKVKSATIHDYEATLYMSKGDFHYKKKNNTLQDINFGELVFNTEALRLNYMNGCAGHVYPDRDFCFPQILNKSYFEELPANTGLHYFNPYLLSLLKTDTSGDVSTQRYVHVPMLYLRFVLKKVFEYLKFSFIDTFFSFDDEYNSLALFNAVDCNCGESGFFLYPNTKILLNYHVPKMSINDFLTGIETFFNLRFFIDNINKTVTLKSVNGIVNEDNCIEFSKNVISIATLTEDPITGYHLKMSMDTDDELYESKRQHDEDQIEHLKESVQSLSDLNPWPSSELLDIRWVKEKNSFYQLWTNKQWMVWNNTIDLFMEYVYKTRKTVIETKFSTLLNYNTGDDAVVGVSRESWKDVSGKLFFTYYNEDDPDWKKVVATPISDSKSLYFGGSTGLFYQHYKAFFDFMINIKTVKCVKQMSFIDLRNLDFSSKYLIFGIKYLISEVNVTLKKDRVLPATLVLKTSEL